MIEESLDNLRMLYNAGVRYMTLTHAKPTKWAGSSGKGTPNTGLTDLGKQVVREMNRLGMMVDISHVSDKTFWDVIEVSTAPLIASHSSCRALADVPRNMTDEMIAALGKKGGVIHINFNCEFIRKGAGRKKRVTLDEVVAHIEHAVKIAGIDHVGLGSDFDGIDCAPVGLDDVSKFPNLTRALIAKGYKPEEIRKLMGENTLRVMREIASARK
jgi:membrane dipeptidase